MLKIKNIKNIKITSVISVLAVSAVLSPAVLADEASADLTANAYTLELFSINEKIELENETFTENGELYLPLREVAEKYGAVNNQPLSVDWDNGRVTVSLTYDDNIIHRYRLEIGASELYFEQGGRSDPAPIDFGAPILKDSKTYATYSMLSYILSDYRISYEIYGENGELLSGNSDEIVAAANTWAEALKTRDGQPRYEIMTPAMQEQFVEGQKQIAGEAWNYVIGYSSPKTVSYDISLDGNTVLITYLQEDNTGEQYILKEKITLEKIDGKILVSAAEDIIEDIDENIDEDIETNLTEKVETEQ